MSSFFAGFVIILFFAIVLWIISVFIENVSIVDIFWGPGFVIITWFYYMTTDGLPLRKLLMVLLVTLWGVRLGAHIAYRNIGKGEDFRYKEFRRKYGKKYWWFSFFQTFLLQGVLIWLLSTPILMTQTQSTPFRILDVIGLLVWCFGFFFEAVGDWQLARFKANPKNKGKVLNTGLWRYTRHPNYFGDATVWWGYYIIAVSVTYGLFTIYAPIIMTLLLLRVSGVALLEKTLTQTKPQYQDYINRTSAFVPMPPKKG